jgi:hypothetical protein
MEWSDAMRGVIAGRGGSGRRRAVAAAVLGVGCALVLGTTGEAAPSRHVPAAAAKQFVVESTDDATSAPQAAPGHPHPPNQNEARPPSESNGGPGRREPPREGRKDDRLSDSERRMLA